MALNILGEGFDIHGGARELAFPHHENEVAQSESYLDGRCFAKTWWHCGELRINGEKTDPKKQYVVHKGDTVSLGTPGGGGHGDPRLRDVAALAVDIDSGYVTDRSVYG